MSSYCHRRGQFAVETFKNLFSVGRGLKAYIRVRWRRGATNVLHDDLVHNGQPVIDAYPEPEESTPHTSIQFLKYMRDFRPPPQCK
jgi:hypothetical protein